MKLIRVIFMLLVTVSLGVQAADYKVAPGQVQAQLKAQNAKGQAQSDKAKVQRERHMASKMEEKENGGASPPAIRRMPLNR